jgi:ABC-type lipoprotein export system ATPase subunit
VIVTHDNRVLEYADRIVHIEDGRLIEPLVGGGVAHLAGGPSQKGEHMNSYSA